MEKLAFCVCACFISSYDFHWNVFRFLFLFDLLPPQSLTNDFNSFIQTINSVHWRERFVKVLNLASTESCTLFDIIILCFIRWTVNMKVILVPLSQVECNLIRRRANKLILFSLKNTHTGTQNGGKYSNTFMHWTQSWDLIFKMNCFRAGI